MVWAISAGTPATINNTTTGNCSLAVSEGSLILVAAAVKDRSSWVLPSVGDGVNDYSLVGSIVHSMLGSTVDGCAIWRAVAQSAGTLSIKLTATTAVYARFAGLTVSGYNASDIVAAVYSGEVSAYSSTALTITSLANSPPNALAVTMMSSAANDAANVQVSAESIGTYTQLARSSVGSYFPAWSVDYQELTASGTQSIKYTFSGYNEGASGLLVLLNPASAGQTNEIVGAATLPRIGSITAFPTSLLLGETGTATVTYTVSDQYGILLENAVLAGTATPSGVVSLGSIVATSADGTTDLVVTGSGSGNAVLDASCGGVAAPSVYITVTGGGGALPLILRSLV